MKKFLEYYKKARRGLLYALVLLAYLLAQNVVFSRLPLFGIKTLFMPALVVAVALFEGGTRGGYFGLAAGVLCDLFLGGQKVMFTILFPVIGFLVGFLVDFFLNRRFFSYFVLSLAALALSAATQMAPLLFFHGQSPWALWTTALVQTVWGIPFIFPSYYICKMMPRKPIDKAPSPY